MGLAQHHQKTITESDSIIAMKVFAPLLCLLVGAVCAEPQTGSATAKDACSVANTGNNNTFNITCQGISGKLGSQLIELLNRVAKNQADAEAMIAKLDGCLVGVREVREQQQPWNLTVEQRVELRRLLFGSKAKALVHVIPSDRNASLMGADLLSVLKDAGWDTGDGLTADFGLNPAIVGIVLIVSHRDLPEAVRLQSALRTLGIQTDGEIDDAKRFVSDTATIVIAVGAKPPVSH
jgi:hypothetical protein